MPREAAARTRDVRRGAVPAGDIMGRYSVPHCDCSQATFLWKQGFR